MRLDRVAEAVRRMLTQAQLSQLAAAAEVEVLVMVYILRQLLAHPKRLLLVLLVRQDREAMVEMVTQLLWAPFCLVLVGLVALRVLQEVRWP